MKTLEQLFSSPAGRRAGDEAIDALPVTATLAEAIEVWECAYYARTGASPVRKP